MNKKFVSVARGLALLALFLILSVGTAHAATSTTNSISLGSKGPDVKALQQYLKTNGFSTAKPDGVFGKKTLTSLKKFQSKIGLAPDGTIDPLDWQIIDKNPLVVDPVGVSAAAFASGAGDAGSTVTAISTNVPDYSEIQYTLGVSNDVQVYQKFLDAYNSWFKVGYTDDLRDTMQIQRSQKLFDQITQKMWATQGVSLENVEANYAGAYNAIVRVFNATRFLQESSKVDQWKWTQKTYLQQVADWKSTWTSVIQEKLNTMKISQDVNGNRTGETGGDWGKVVVDKSGKLVSAELSVNGSVPPSVINAIVSRPESQVVVQDDKNTWSAPTISSIYGLDQVTSQVSTAPGIGVAGKSLSIRGTNFGTPTVVKMNNQVAVSTLISSTQINALIPATLSGQVTVTVTNPGLTPASASVAILPGSPDTTACAISEFKAATSTILTSQPVVLSWSTSGCASVSVSNASMVIGGSSPLTGSVTVNPVATTTYTLTTKDSKGVTKTATTTITVGSETVVFPVITAVKGLNSSTNNYTDNIAVAGQFLVIGSNNTFSTSGNIVKINGQTVDTLHQSANQINVKIPATYTSGSYAVTVTNSNGFQSQVWNVQISGVAAASNCSIINFSVDTIAATTSKILSWYVSAGCVSVSISNLGTVNSIGSLAVSPAATTTYTLTAKNAGGVTVTKDAVITIDPVAAVPPATSMCGAAKGVCSVGTASSVSLDTLNKVYTWSCTNGTTAGYKVCTSPYAGAVNGACGSAVNTEAPYSLSGISDNSYFCYTGTKASLSQKSDGTYSWYCNGSAASTGVNAGSSVICANKTASGTSSNIPTTLAAPAAPVQTNGVCGGAVNVWSPQVPTSNFCSAGTASTTTPNADGTYSWTCAGVGTGAVTVSCQNIKSPYTVAPSAKSKVAAAASKLKSAASTKLKSALSIFKKNKTKEDQTAAAGTSVKN
jgi:peptidoglycan hydrolase-like protein with peptidoglycan-binding domain